MGFVTTGVTLRLFEQAASMGASETVSKLSDLLNGGSVTARQAADKAEKAGVDLRYGTIAAYWSGGHGRPTAKTLSKLAKVVPFTEKQLQEAAWDVSAPLGPYVAPDEAALLDERQRRAVDELIRSIVATRGQRHELEVTQKSGASGEAREDQKNASRVSTGYGEHADDYDLVSGDGGTDPEGQAADDARPNVWREQPGAGKADDLIPADQDSGVDADTTQSDVDLAGGWRRGGGESETRRIRREQDEAAERGDV